MKRLGIRRMVRSSALLAVVVGSLATAAADVPPASAGAPPAVAVEHDFDGDGFADVLWYGSGPSGDYLWSSRGDGTFGSRPLPVDGTFHALSGDFDGSGSDDVFWYAPGPEPDFVERFDGSSPARRSHRVSGVYEPLVGDFDGSGSDDVFWYAPGGAGDYVWFSEGGGFRSVPQRVSGVYEPLVGDFDGSGSDDVFWYAAGAAGDYLWRGGASGFASSPHPVRGSYLALTGDFDADGADDVFWYAAGSAGDFVWYGGSTFSSRPARVSGAYRPVVAAFDGVGDDILWYAPGAGGDYLWRGSGRSFSSSAQRVGGIYQPLGERRPTFTVRRAPVGPGTTYPLQHSYRSGCPVGPAELVALRFPHWDFGGGTSNGVVIVRRSVASDVERVLHRLHDLGFPIRRAVPVDTYGGDDDRSMAADNTSAFNCRAVAGSSTLSQHAYGWALDLDPVENPYVRGSVVEPPSGANYTDRSDRRPGMVHSGGPVVSAFASIGWKWGGDWSSAKDYQHFSLTGR